MTEPGAILVSEVFSAIQGEGALVGRRQVFLRLTGCNIRCTYCDQPEALDKRPGPCRIEQTPGRRDWRWDDSPLSYEAVVDAVDELWRALPHHSVSLTGGEPLMQSRRLAELAPMLAERGHRLYLETNGMLVEGLRRVMPWITDAGVDVKLPSVDGQGVDLDDHRRFLELAATAPGEVFAKVVVGPRTDESELVAAVAMCAEAAPRAPVYLQPLSPQPPAELVGPTPEQVLAWHDLALRVHPDVRVVPQTHKLIGQL